MPIELPAEPPADPPSEPAAQPRPEVDPRTGRRTDGGREPDRLALLARLQESFAATVPDTDPDARVPACGDWRVHELVVHLAGIHHWAAGMAVGDTSRPEELAGPDLTGPDLTRPDLTGPDGGPSPLEALYREHAAELRSTLAAAGPDGAARTLVGDGPASFWWRRQAYETLVHLHDLQAARLGSGPAAVDEGAVDVAPEVWADAVDEVVTMFQPRQVLLGRMSPLSDHLRVVATDLGWSWTLGGAGREPAATVAAPAHGLALLLWGRLDLDEAGATVQGDGAAARRTLAAPIVP